MARNTAGKSYIQDREEEGGETSGCWFGKSVLTVKGRWNYPKLYQKANVSVDGAFV
jgi:hypothetical protein